MADLAIRPVQTADAATLVAIYNHYVRGSIITFEEVEIDAAEMSGRIAAITATHAWLVGEVDGKLIGYAYSGKYGERAGYRHSTISSIYLHREACGQGWGVPLYAALLDRLRALEFHMVVGRIALPNPASLALHERLGFEKTGHFPEIGRKFGKWIDVVDVQCRLGKP